MISTEPEMPEQKTYTAALVIIGNEVLSGRTRDANMQYIGTELNAIGVRLMEVRVVPDIEEMIIEAVNTVRARYDYVFTTGGIGPTHDDITSATIAKAFGLDHGRHPEAEALLLAHYNPEDVTEARMKMSETPAGAELLFNPISKAPGFRVENVYVMAGIPRIMQAMFEGYRHRLTGGEPMQSRSIAAYIGEGKLGDELGRIQDRHPDVEIGSYPFVRDGKFGTSLVARHTEADAIDAVIVEICDLVRHHGQEPIEESL
jgi:molybdenum cofactor synthesis domain-containing protein